MRETIRVMFDEMQAYPLELRAAAALHLSGVKSEALHFRDYYTLGSQTFFNVRMHLRCIERGEVDLSPGSRLAELAGFSKVNEAQP